MNDNLKWLAENVHEWQNGCCAIQKYDYGSYDFLYGSDPEQFRGVGEICFTREQWQAARDELSGKPSWDEVVGEWVAQDEDGHWYSFDSKPYHDDCCWDVSPCYREKYGKGEVLGDWRNTLERRPDNHSVEPTEKVWRGPNDGLPPVGSCCELRFISGVWQEVKIEHYTREYVVFTDMSGRERIEYIRAFEFRPVRSEEDKVVEEMAESGAIGAFFGADNGAISDAAFRALFKHLVRHGYRKQENPK